MKHILMSMGVGMLIGGGLVYHVMRSPVSNVKPADTPRVVTSQRWCDPSHVIPVIPADQCGGISSCDRSPGYPRWVGPGVTFDWPALCRRFTAQQEGKL
jgi:hypothetical protein